ncbi:MAG: transporter substrate-binding domain-containing protein [Treponema sp.]|jgi:signal transduction histidine kinase/ActR/RegA family two-component response regulator|nr:transporter substrate-binding domain-containing protein [Treponema sp.]
MGFIKKRVTLAGLAGAFFLALLPGRIVAQSSVLDLTEAERNFIREHPVIRVGIDPVFAPFEFLDDKENYTGIAPDYLALISVKTGLRFEPDRDITYAEAQEKVLAHELDLLPTLGWTAERERDFLLSRRYYEYRLALVVQEGTPVKSVDDFRGRSLAVQGNTSNAAFAFSTLQAGVSLYDSEEEALLALAEGRETAMLGYLPTVLYAIRNLGLSNLNYISFDSENNHGFHMGIRNDWPELRGILDKAIATITPAEKAEIQSRWIQVNDSGEQRRILRLTGAGAAVLLSMLAFILWKSHNDRKKVVWLKQNEERLREMVRQRTEELQNQTQLAVAASQSKSAFLARMSHEIRTPMNVIIGFSDVLSQHDLPGEILENIEHIKQAGKGLLAIINDILDFSKIEAGKMDITNEEYMFGSLIHDVENIIKFRIAETPLKFIANVDANLPCKLRGDMGRVRQILLNLLNNAIKYTREGSITLTVSGTVREDGRILLSFEVADTGIGIQEEDKEKIFGSFSRVDTKKNQGIEGTGLGLAISQNLCRMMGGEIRMHSVYGEGSVFTALIPQEIVDGQPFREEAGTDSPRYGDEKRKIGFTAPEARVLAVDDSSVNLTVIKHLLLPYKMRVDFCLSGEKAVVLVKQNSYDLIFMDHMMPGMNGVEAVEVIRDSESGTTVPIIALTANAISGMREMFLKNGFSDYLSKPVDMTKLDRLIEAWLSDDLKVKIP